MKTIIEDIRSDVFCKTTQVKEQKNMHTKKETHQEKSVMLSFPR